MSNVSKYLSKNLELAVYPAFFCIVALPALVVLSLAAGVSVWRSVPESWRVELFLQYGDGRSPYAFARIPALQPEQSYEILLELLLPRTKDNHDLGNFMASLDIVTPSNKSIASARKPHLMLPAWFTLSPTQTVYITLFSEFHSRIVSGLTALVSVGRDDAWRSIGSGHGRELTVHSAFLVGRVKPTGLRALLSSHPILVSCIAALLFFVVSTLTMCASLTYVAQASSTVIKARGPLPDKDLSDHGSDQKSVKTESTL